MFVYITRPTQSEQVFRKFKMESLFLILIVLPFCSYVLSTVYEIDTDANVFDEFVDFYKKRGESWTLWTWVWSLTDDQRQQLCQDVYTALYNYNPNNISFQVGGDKDEKYILDDINKDTAEMKSYSVNVCICVAYNGNTAIRTYYLAEGERGCIFVVFFYSNNTSFANDVNAAISQSKEREELIADLEDSSYESYIQYKLCPLVIVEDNLNCI